MIRTLVVAAVLAVLCAAKAQHESTWLLMEITSEGHSRILAARNSTQPPSRCRGHPRHPMNHVVIQYAHPATGEACAVPLKDPRKEYHDHAPASSTRRGAFGGGVRHHDSVEFAVTVHRRIDTLHLHDYKNPRMMSRHFLTEAHHRAFATLQNVVTVNPDEIETTAVQVVGPIEEQFNLVFISAGYTTAERSRYNSDVDDLVAFLQSPIDGLRLSSQPYRRYFANTNIWSIWQPSPESGASRPAPAGPGRMVDNNLDCSYGATVARTLSCNRARVQLVGSYAPPDPANTLLVVLVNDDLFGGTGGSNVCALYNGERKFVIFIHELGHAAADLADEYDYGMAEARNVEMINCHWSNQNVPWERWILSGIIPRPTQVCTYQNYFKPTPGACLMESDQQAMCPVCTAASLQNIYDHGVNLANPRFPNEYERAFVRLGESVTLYMNLRVPYHRDETGTFEVTWSVVNSSLTFPQNVHAFGFGVSVNGTGFNYPGPGDYEVQVTIVDRTNMFLASTRAALENRNRNNATAMRQIHTFRVTVYDPSLTTVNCSQRATPSGDSYCAACDPGREAYCDMDFRSRPLESATDLQGTLSGLQQWLFGIGSVFVAIGIMIFILIWRTMALHAEHNPSEILPLGKNIMIVRIVLLILQCTLLVCSSGCIIFSVYMYGQLSIFGRTIVLGIIACSVVVWFASFVGFCAAYYKNRSVLFVNFILLLLLFGCALLFTVLLLYILFNVESPGVRNQLQAEWRSAVESDPRAACTLQSVLECSGFNVSCRQFAYNPRGTTDCPANCELSNTFTNPCYNRVKEFVSDKFGIASVGGIILSVFLFVTMVLSLVLGCSIKTRRNNVYKERRERHANGQMSLSEEEIAMLHREFKKIDRDGSGDISRLEFSTFYNAVMGASLSPRELEEYFDKLDADGNGVLSFDEFIKVYVPQKQPKKRSLAKTKSMIYAPGDSFAAPEMGAAEELESDPEPEAEAEHPRSVQSQRRAQDIDLDLVLDQDLQEDMSPEEVAKLQEQQARDEAARVAAAQAERQKRMAMDRPSNIDVDLVVDDLGMGGTLADANLDDMNGMDLDIDLDDEEFE